MKRSDILKLEELAKEACAIGYEQFGTNWHNLSSNIRVYTSETRNHQAAEFFGVDVGLHRPAKIELTINEIDRIPAIIRDTVKELAEFKAEIAKQSELDTATTRQDRIDALALQLQELKK